MEKLLVVPLIVCISCFILVETALAELGEPGVVEGDFFVYEMYGVFNSNDPDTVIEIPTFERNTTDWVRIDIAEVYGSIVHQVYTLHFKDGSEKGFHLQTDLDPDHNDGFNFTEKGVPICASNINVGDPLATAQLSVKERYIKIYSSGVKRETNRVSWDFSDDWGYCDFDRKTGMLVELIRVHLFISPGNDQIISKTDVIRLTHSSRWEIEASTRTTEDHFSFIIIAIVAMLSAKATHRRVQCNLSARMGKKQRGREDSQRSFMRTISAAKTIGSQVSHSGGA
jgi:hypothetical protein